MPVDSIGQSTNDLINAITNEFSAVSDSIDTRLSIVEGITLTNNNIILDTIQLMFSDLLNQILTTNQHKLFYLKSKIDALDNGQSLIMPQLNYLNILKSELDKLNKENKLLERE